MKAYQSVLLCLCVFFLFLSSSAQKIKRCDFDNLYTEKLKDSSFIAYQEEFKRFLKNYKFEKSDTLIRIPLVFHVIYKNQTENVSEAQIQSQIDVLNEDFNKRNSDTTNASGYSIANVGIEFCLAKRTPDGLSTNGITRTMTTIDNIGNTRRNHAQEYYELAPIWDRNEYINIWICDTEPNEFAIGFAVPPSFNEPDAEGVVVDYTVLGTIGTAEAPYDKGRTVTHEVGHMFELRHPWGDNPRLCGFSDFVDDTPEQLGEIFDCPASNISCGSEDMLSNFMQYIDDRCMGNFTEGQKTRMRASIQSTRPNWNTTQECWAVGLNESQLLNQVVLSPIPSDGEFSVSFPKDLSWKNLDLTVIDITGKMIGFETIQEPAGFKIVLTENTKGVYLLKMKSSTSSGVKKLIIN